MAEDDVAAPLGDKDSVAVLAVARLVAVFPIPLTDFGEPGPALAQATSARLVAAGHGLSRRRLDLVRAGVALIEPFVPGNNGTGLLASELGRRFGEAQHRMEAIALVALALATISSEFVATNDATARVWLDGARRLHSWGASI